MAQILEGLLAKTLNQLDDVWHIKLQVHPMAVTPMPADYWVICRDRNYLIECKETKGNCAFSFKRFNQRDSMLRWQDFSKMNTAMILLSFREQRVDKSTFFLMPLSVYLRLEEELSKTRKSVPKKYLLEHDEYNLWRVYPRVGGYLDIEGFFL